jgi:hypothetical protein
MSTTTGSSISAAARQVLRKIFPQREDPQPPAAPRRRRDVSQTLGSNPRMRRLLKKAEESER